MKHQRCRAGAARLGLSRWSHALRIALLAIAVFAAAGPLPADVTLVPAGAVWKYLDNGSDPGSAWRLSSFADTAWKSGAAELGYGDGDEKTAVSYGPSASNKYVTTYFRLSFNVANPAAFSSLKLRLLRDDGAVVYLNGTEVRRDNMPSGTVTYKTYASSALGAPAESTFYETTVSPSRLAAGANVLAVEVHQANGTSTDLSFNLELVGVDAQPVTRGPYLQMGTSRSIVVRWRTGAPTDSVVHYGASPAALTGTVSNGALTTEHEILLSGLTPNTQYFYSVGTSTATLSAGADLTFYTAPATGTAQATRIWVLGDCGTGDSNAKRVRDAYATFAGTDYTDLWLMLGDNAYDNGTDAEYQSKVFAIYPTTFKQSVLWPCLGNHDTAQSTNPPANLPYFQMFTLPTQAQAGGVASGTEKYYSYDVANIHFVVLDSMSSSRLATGAMATWLKNDLAATRQQWVVAYWHHPPYSNASNASDSGAESTDMRQNIVPILEAGGVDLVLAGHCHDYERSFLINGHYGASGTFVPSMKVDGGDGREDGSGAYRKPLARTANRGAVYIVLGSSAKLGSWRGGSTADINPNPYPAMYASYRRLGSVVLDVNGSRMDVKFLRDTGGVDDHFTIRKDLP